MSIVAVNNTINAACDCLWSRVGLGGGQVREQTLSQIWLAAYFRVDLIGECAQIVVWVGSRELTRLFYREVVGLHALTYVERRVSLINESLRSECTRKQAPDSCRSWCLAAKRRDGSKLT